MNDADREQLKRARAAYMSELDEYEAAWKQAIRDHLAKSEAAPAPAPKAKR